MTVLDPFRVYGPDELGPDGYPPAWHRIPPDVTVVALDEYDLFPAPEDGIKHIVRSLAGQRCVRCQHPYVPGRASPSGEWSPCDEHCAHGGEGRWQDGIGFWTVVGEVGRLVSQHPVEARWRILTVHHLDGDKANCRWWNLVALCQRCHLTIQGKVRMDRRWLHEHSPWFRPYVAGYYAWVYGGVELSRRQVEERMGELLALEERQLQIDGVIL
jgi:hypothetical protein